MVLPRKINFTQMGRYSDSSEQRFRQLFEHEFDWMQFNLFLMRQRFGESVRKAIAIDASHISKSGKKTPYIGKFWSGCASAMKRGLEILGIAIINIDSRDCMMLRAEQTPSKAYLEKQGENYNLVDWYLDVLRKYKDKLLGITRYVVADAWFSKAKFVNDTCLMGFHVISRLRDDAALWYSHSGVHTGKRGRPRIKGEKIDFEKLDLQRCEILDIEGGRAYSVKAYSKAMKRNIKVVVHYPKSGGHKIYFSTNLDMSAKGIIEYYRTRFQIEFCFRDSKQFSGLNDCQARDLRKLDFAFNASLASVNIAKFMRQQYYPSLSIGLLKAYLSNIYMLKRIFSRSGLKPNRTFNTKLIKELFGIVAEAA
ncbi:transposase [Bacteroides muris (ex Fokt et al. 2023)]|nr:transposase [Bacteroides muris (ex Fokt et al. 2023)]